MHPARDVEAVPLHADRHRPHPRTSAAEHGTAACDTARPFDSAAGAAVGSEADRRRQPRTHHPVDARRPTAHRTARDHRAGPDRRGRARTSHAHPDGQLRRLILDA